MNVNEDGPKLYVWFEEKPAGTWLCLEFHGNYQHNAPWYGPFWRRLRMELGAKDATASTGWLQGHGGLAGKVWRLNLASESLRASIGTQQAHEAIITAVKAFNGYPHRAGIYIETI